MTRRLLPVALALAALSCGNRASTVQFAAICAPTKDCTFAAKCGLQSIGENRLDLDSLPAADRDFFLVVEVHNQAQSNADAGAGRINTLDAFLREIEITYEGGGLAGTTTKLQQSVPANGTAVLGIQVVDGPGVTTLEANVGAGAEAIVVARVKGKGVFGDGSSFETSDFKIPFRVCHGCVTNTSDVKCGPAGACPHLGQEPSVCIQ